MRNSLDAYAKFRRERVSLIMKMIPLIPFDDALDAL